MSFFSLVVYPSTAGSNMPLVSIETVHKCLHCKKVIKIPKMREHIGGHIIRGEVDCFSCGFCGGSTGCSISLRKTTHKIRVPESNCSMFQKFSLTSAQTSTANTPCTNRPVDCQICKVVYWSYAMQKHYEQKHVDSPCPELIAEEEKAIMKVK